LARSFGAAPNPTGFGDRSTQAGALRNWFGSRGEVTLLT